MEPPFRCEVPGDPADPGAGPLQLYRVMVQHAPQGFVVQDAAGRVLDANPAAQRILGLSLEQLQGRTSRDSRWQAIRADGSPLPEEDHPAMVALRTGRPAELAAMGVHNPERGGTVWLEASAVPVFHPGEPAPCQVFVTFLDITGRKQAQDALRASEEKFSKAFHASPDSVNINRLADGLYLAVNEGFTRITGYRPEEVLGRSSLPGDLGIWVHGEDRDRLLEGLRRDGLVQGLEAQFRRRDGSCLTGLMSASLIEVEGQACVLTITREITERKRIETELLQSRASLSALIESTSDLVWSVDRNHRLLAFNATLAAHLRAGYGTEAALGTDLGALLPPARAVTWAALYEQCLADGPFTLEFPLDDGRILAVALNQITQGGAVMGVSVFGKDITEARKAEAAVRESAQRLELATSSASLGVWELNLADGTQIWNDRMYEIYGLEPQSSHPDHAYWCARIVHPDDLQATDAAIQEALAGNRPYDVEFRVVRPDGSVRHVKSDALLIRDLLGRPARVIGINRDRTREVEAEAERRRLLLELQHAEKMESLGSLAGGVAHDINNVLAAIMGMASVLRESSPGEETRAKALDTITLACIRGRDVVKSLRYFSRRDLEAVAQVDLNILVKEMIQLLAPATLDRIRLSTDFQEPLGQIQGDGGALSHALVNLCVNAVDAMPEGGRLTLRTRNLAGGWIQLEVEDTGVGMSLEVNQKALDPFFTTKPQGKGTGLGLSMVYSTVKAHRGQMEIRSAPGQGTCVTLRFPAGAPEA